MNQREVKVTVDNTNGGGILELEAELNKAVSEFCHIYDSIYDKYPTWAGDIVHDDAYELLHGTIQGLIDEMQNDVDNIDGGDVEEDLLDYWVTIIARLKMRSHSLKQFLEAAKNYDESWSI